MFSCCLLLLAARLLDKCPAYYIRYFVLSLCNWRCVAGSIQVEAGMTCFSLGWRG